MDPIESRAEVFQSLKINRTPAKLEDEQEPEEQQTRQLYLGRRDQNVALPRLREAVTIAEVASEAAGLRQHGLASPGREDLFVDC